MTRASRFFLAVTAALAVLAALLTATPASAAPAKPSPPYVSATTTSTMTVRWDPVPGATSYQVYYARSRAGVSKSWAPRKSTRSSYVSLSGLATNGFYCVKVRALRGSSAGTKSSTHCKKTMRRNNVYAASKVEGMWVATYNLCASKCDAHGTWASRAASAVASIEATDADVLAFQESDKVQDDLAERLEPLGYAQGGYSKAKSIYYRTSRFTQVGSAQTWVSGNAEAVAVDLRSRSSGKRGRYVSAHLTSGDSRAAEATRQTETRSLVAWLRAEAAATDLWLGRVVVMGDFNSHRSRTNDTPLTEMARGGWHDAYDRSRSYANPQHNSANQWDANPRFGKNMSSLFGAHVDKVFLPDAIGSAGWRTVHRFTSTGRYVTPLGSDHAPVRVKLYVPR